MIGRILHRNLYLYDFALRLRFRKYNIEMRDFIASVAAVDPIRDFEDFRREMGKIPKRTFNDVYVVKRSFAENTLYGYASNLLDYAGEKQSDLFYLPVMEHGVPYSSIFDPKKYKLHNSYIFQGKENYSQWMATKKNAAYYIGPYIHYCKGYYDERELRRQKDANGLTVLVFLPHSTEVDSFSVEVNDVIDGLRAVGKEVNTVLVCVYCMDVPQLEMNVNANVRYVCAGFKLDPLFACRLKSIIELADIVYYSTFSSSVGYSYYMGKEILCNPSPKDFDQLERIVDKSACQKLLDMQRLFGPFANVAEEERRSFIERYWGISEIKSPEEISTILRENKSRIHKHLGF